MGKRLYVGNLSYSVDSPALQEMFAAHGNVTSAEVISDRMSGRSKGFGFVEMSTDEEAASAIAALNGQENGGRALTVNEAKPREERSRRRWWRRPRWIRWRRRTVGGGGRGGDRGGRAADAVLIAFRYLKISGHGLCDRGRFVSRSMEETAKARCAKEDAKDNTQ